MRRNHWGLSSVRYKPNTKEELLRKANRMLSWSLPCPHSAKECDTKKEEIAERYARGGILTKEEILKQLKC